MTLTTLPSPITSSPATGGVVIRRLALARSGPVARRHYWSFRCAKPRTWTYHYWGSGSHARQRHWRTESAEERPAKASSSGPAAAREDAGKSSYEPDRAFSSNNDHLSEDNHDKHPGKDKVRTEDQQFLTNEWAAWEKAARAHADARFEFLRRALEKDPYAVFFGGREARGVWNPWRSRGSFWHWPGLWERWGRKSKHLAEYLEARSQEMSRLFEDAKQDAEKKSNGSKRGDKTVKEENGMRTESTKNMKSETINGCEVGTIVETSRSTPIPSMKTSEEYIDLITLRKVQRFRSDNSSSVAEIVSTSSAIHGDKPPPANISSGPLSSNDKGTQINVKKHTAEANQQPTQTTGDQAQHTRKSPLSGFASQDWLRREGFSTGEPNRAIPLDSKASNQPSPAAAHSKLPDVILTGPGATLPVPHVKNGQLQSVVDRWSTKIAVVPAAAEGHPPKPAAEASLPTGSATSLKDRIVYDPKDITKDDVDLIRANDIRAASGKRSTKPPQLSAAELHARRTALTNQFVESQRKFEVALRREVIEALEQSVVPTKSPLWALWMLYDHAARKDWELWERKRRFTRKGEQELKEMQYMSQAFLQQMPSPSEIFASGGSDLSRYLDANYVSSGLKAVQAALNRWHMEMQSALVPRGVQPFPDDVLAHVRKALVKYHMELRRQILSGKGPQVVPSRNAAAEARRTAADKILAKEVASLRAAMQQHEERSRAIAIASQSSNAQTEFVPWLPPGAQRREADIAKAAAQTARDAKLSREIRDIYEDRYGKITTQHRQLQPIDEVSEGQSVIWDEHLEKADSVDLEVEHDEYGSKSTSSTARLGQPPTTSTTATESSARISGAPEPTPSASCAPKNETATVLLTLGNRTGELTLHPPSVWPILQARMAADTSPLESPIVCNFLTSAADPQRVLREVVNLQAKGFRLASGRNGCLVFQQPVPIRGTPLAVKSEASKADIASPAAPGPASEAAPASHAKPLPLDASTKYSSSTTATVTDAAKPPESKSTAYDSPIPRPYSAPSAPRPERRTPPYSPGSSTAASNWLIDGATAPPPEDKAANTESPHGPKPNAPRPHTSQPAGRRHTKSQRYKHHQQHRRRRRGFRLYRALLRILLSATVLATGAYGIGLFVEWRRVQAQRLAFLEAAGFDPVESPHPPRPAQRRGASSGQAADVEPEPLGALPDSLRRWWGRVWWLGEGDMLERREWEGRGNAERREAPRHPDARPWDR